VIVRLWRWLAGLCAPDRALRLWPLPFEDHRPPHLASDRREDEPLGRG
jgi:hypothetical protein